MDGGILEAIAAVGFAYEAAKAVTDVVTDALDEAFDSLDSVVTAVRGVIIRSKSHYEPYAKAYKIMVLPWITSHRFYTTFTALKTNTLHTEPELATAIILISDLLRINEIDPTERFPADDYYLTVYNPDVLAALLTARASLIAYSVRALPLYVTKFREQLTNIDKYISEHYLAVARDGFEIDNGLSWVS